MEKPFGGTMKTRKNGKQNWLFNLGSMALLILLMLGGIQCSGGSSSSGGPDGNFPIGVAPSFLMKNISDGSLRAELSVYGPDSSLVYNEDLQINPETGEVFSSQFELDRC